MEDVGVEKGFGGGAFGVDLGGRDGLSSDGVDRLKAGVVAESHHNLLRLSAFWIVYAGWGEKGIRCDGSVLYTKRIRFFKNNLLTRWKGRGFSNTERAEGCGACVVGGFLETMRAR